MHIPQYVDTADLPQWHAFSTRTLPGKRIALVLSVTPESAAAFQAIFQKEIIPIVEHYQHMFRFPHFERDIWKGFGFHGAVLPARASKGQVEFVVPLITNRKRSAYAIAASLSLLLIPYASFDETRKPGSNCIQLMTLETNLSNAATWGAMMRGEASPALRAWVRTNHANERVHARICETMRRAYQSLHWSKHSSRFGFRVHLTEDGRFSLDCPGNACDVSIYWDGVHVGDDSGARISCHNLDTRTTALPRRRLSRNV
jgi:hypothetical protein